MFKIYGGKIGLFWQSKIFLIFSYIFSDYIPELLEDFVKNSTLNEFLSIFLEKSNILLKRRIPERSA